MELCSQVESPLGPIVLWAGEDALSALRFEGQRCFPAVCPPLTGLSASPIFMQTAEWLALYFSGKAPDWTPPLRPKGTPFQLAVWELLREIPYGKTGSYGALAGELERRCGRRVSARAVGGAVGRNPISLLIPCHRIVGADGSLTGYAGGLERKRYLLDLERGSLH